MLFGCQDGHRNIPFQAALNTAANQCGTLAEESLSKDGSGQSKPKRGTLEPIIHCITEQQRPVWAFYAPDFLNAWELHRAKLTLLAEDYDNRKMSFAKYSEGAAALGLEFNDYTTQAVQSKGRGQAETNRIALACIASPNPMKCQNDERMKAINPQAYYEQRKLELLQEQTEMMRQQQLKDSFGTTCQTFGGMTRCK
ncbi:hypothetical protein ACYOEI_01215 [Singulisphaera rosea]